MSGEAPLTVTFTNLSTPTQALNGALWTFGDGASLSITGGITAGLTHTHVYTRPGLHTVILSAGDGVVTGTLTRTGYITAIGVDFRAEPLSGEAPLTVTFTNLSTPTQALNGALWTFGDGATLVITGGLTGGMTHTHVYTRHGIFTVGLSAGDGVVTDTLTRPAYITAKSYTTTTRVIGYSYDGLYRLIGAAYSTGQAFTYTYDAAGNRTTQIRTLTGTTHVTAYVYDIADRLDYFVEDSQTTDLSWDDGGNLLTQGTSVYTWDAAGRLIGATVDGVDSSFAYNGLGRRVARTVDGLTTAFVLDVGSELPEVIAATTGESATSYVQIQGQILAEVEEGTWEYALPDALGGSARCSTKTALKPNDKRQKRRRYLPFVI